MQTYGEPKFSLQQMSWSVTARDYGKYMFTFSEILTQLSDSLWDFLLTTIENTILIFISWDKGIRKDKTISKTKNKMGISPQGFKIYS